MLRAVSAFQLLHRFHLPRGCGDVFSLLHLERSTCPVFSRFYRTTFTKAMWTNIANICQHNLDPLNIFFRNFSYSPRFIHGVVSVIHFLSAAPLNGHQHGHESCEQSLGEWMQTNASWSKFSGNKSHRQSSDVIRPASHSRATDVQCIKAWNCLETSASEQTSSSAKNGTDTEGSQPIAADWPA